MNFIRKTRNLLPQVQRLLSFIVVLAASLLPMQAQNDKPAPLPEDLLNKTELHVADSTDETPTQPSANTRSTSSVAPQPTFDVQNAKEVTIIFSDNSSYTYALENLSAEPAASIISTKKTNANATPEAITCSGQWTDADLQAYKAFQDKAKASVKTIDLSNVELVGDFTTGFYQFFSLYTAVTTIKLPAKEVASPISLYRTFLYALALSRIENLGSIRHITNLDGTFGLCPVLAEIDMTSCEFSTGIVIHLPFSNSKNLASISLPTTFPNNADWEQALSGLPSKVTFKLAASAASAYGISYSNPVYLKHTVILPTGVELKFTNNATSIVANFHELNVQQLSSLSSIKVLTEIKLNDEEMQALKRVLQAARQYMDNVDLGTAEYTGTSEQNFKDLFVNLRSLRSVILPSKGSSQPLSFEGTFQNCVLLSQLSNFGKFTNITHLEQTFANCSSMQEINLETIPITNEVSANNTFEGCTALTKVYLPIQVRNFGILNSMLQSAAPQVVFGLNAGTAESYGLSPTDSTYLNHKIIMQPGAFVTYVDGSQSVFGFGELTAAKLNNAESIVLGGTLDNVQLHTYGQAQLGAISTLKSVNMRFLKIDDRQLSYGMPSLFSNFTQLQVVKLPFRGVGIPTSFSSTFKNCSSLTQIDNLESYGNITDLTQTFFGCNKLSEIHFYKRPMDYITISSLIETFSGCSSLRRIYGLNGFEPKEIRGTFDGCSSLEEIDLSKFRSTNVASSAGSSAGLFSGCTQLKLIDLPLEGRQLLTTELISNLQTAPAGVKFFMEDVTQFGLSDKTPVDQLIWQDHKVVTTNLRVEWVDNNGTKNEATISEVASPTAIAGKRLNLFGIVTMGDIANLNAKLKDSKIEVIDMTHCVFNGWKDFPKFSPANLNALIYVTPRNGNVIPSWRNVVRNNTIELLQLDDDYNFAPTEELTAQRVVYTRNCYKDGFHETICLPFAPDNIPQNYAISYLKENNNGEARFKQTQKWEAGRAYMLNYQGPKSDAQEVVEFVGTNVKVITTPRTDEVFRGSFNHLSDNSLVLGIFDGQEIFKQQTEQYVLRPFHAGLNLGQMGGSLRLTFDNPISTDIQETAISSVENEQKAYNLDGTPATRLLKGHLYIINGKKVIY